ISPGAMEAFGYIVQEGRTLQEGDTLQAVFGYHAEKNFEDPNSRHWNSRLWDAINGEEVATYVDIFNDRITMSYDRNFIWNPEAQEQEFDIDDIDAPRPVRPMVVEVVGVLEVRNDWGDIDGAIFMDIATVQRLSMEAQRQEQQNNMDWGLIDAGANARQNTGYDRVLVRVANINAVQGVREQIEEMGFPANSPTQWLEPIQEMARSQQQMLGAIGAVSLFVAAIGIANTMVMSIYERTREIGVMKVIGAALPDIRKLFLMEAAMIGFFGGIIGVLVSYLVSYLLNNHTQVEFLGGMFDWIGEPGTVVSLITPWLSGLALLFASLIGLLSGYFPARRAMRLSALSAIRTE
ncbi:MAG: FtsX-like permease family protein, partial [Defluviitaleaceae bacterium]|nr:FtsX-like permease family protein [Defluviitaleaceae bacterium]